MDAGLASPGVFPLLSDPGECVGSEDVQALLESRENLAHLIAAQTWPPGGPEGDLRKFGLLPPASTSFPSQGDAPSYPFLNILFDNKPLGQSLNISFVPFPCFLAVN
eukprot:TRINITY_DN9059_c0_g1_i1.p1 TRINITY_DN9059_c0_g1~~TRINITY_DN9059_c0_g1_i1.p1  ORF type:complete len:121 (-),score=23.68 TRINITY_DN9059_c0_g1_i1:281-601(-)